MRVIALVNRRATRYRGSPAQRRGYSAAIGTLPTEHGSQVVSYVNLETWRLLFANTGTLGPDQLLRVWNVILDWHPGFDHDARSTLDLDGVVEAGSALPAQDLRQLGGVNADNS